MARYMGQVAVCRVSIPMADAPGRQVPKLPPKNNYIDELVQAKWEKLKLTPSRPVPTTPRSCAAPTSTPSARCRRPTKCGRSSPTPTRTSARSADRPHPRPQRVRRLLGGQVGRPAPQPARRVRRSTQRGTYAFHAWIRNAFATNMPYDQFVRNIIAAQGTVDQHPPVIWYRTVRNLTHQTNDTAQLFLGTRINCAQCHHHPYEKWSQDDYYQLQAFFARMGRKSGEICPGAGHLREARRRRPQSGDQQDSWQPRGLDGPEGRDQRGRRPAAEARRLDGRHGQSVLRPGHQQPLWGHFLGRGLVEPVDDMRVTNPPSNPELLDALAKDLVEHKYDLKHLIRTIMVSTTYQLSSEPTQGNIHDQQNYARAYPRRLLAEVMLDADLPGDRHAGELQGLPKGTRAIQLPDESIALVLPRHVRPADARDGLRVRTAARGQPGAGAATAQLDRPAEQGRPRPTAAWRRC